MLSFLPAPLRGTLAALLLSLNTLFWCWPLFALSLLKLLFPIPAIQRSLRFGMHWIAESWIAMNSFWMDLVRPIRWDVQGLDQVGPGALGVDSRKHFRCCLKIVV